jgi:hypothetical protein
MTHLEDEPPPEADTAHWLRSIRKWRRECTRGVPRSKRPSRRESGEKGGEEERDQHSRRYQTGGMAKEEKGKTNEGEDHKAEKDGMTAAML